MKNRKIKMSVHKVNEVEINYFDYLSKDPDSKCYMSIQAWNSGEGYTIFNDDNQSYSFTHAQWEAIKRGIKYLEAECDKEFQKRISDQIYENI
jgi:hypothetical protein